MHKSRIMCHARSTHWLRNLLALLLVMALLIGGAFAQNDDANVVALSAVGLDFFGPDEVAPGWTTFRFANVSDMTHFAVIQRLPEGIGVEDHQADVAPLFQRGMDLLAEGDVDAAMEAFGGLPAWFGEVVFVGGPGFLGPRSMADATVYLEPGTYMIECYVKTNGIFHSYDPDPDLPGMVHEFVVTGPPTAASEPTADIEVSVSSETGFTVRGDVGPGERTVAVTYEDQTVHENFVGHDVHIARLADDTDLDALEAWMNWSVPGQLESPAPARFVGGLNEMPAGATGYFTVTLEPGRYVWIAEVPDAGAKGMMQVFEVR